MDKRFVSKYVGVSVTFFCLMSWLGAIIKPSLGNVPTTEVPLFDMVGMEITEIPRGINITLTFNNHGYNATGGTVWMNWEKVWCGLIPKGSPPLGNISEHTINFDVNGDGDKSDAFTVLYVNNQTVEVDGVTANSILIPEQRIYYDTGFYDVLEKNSFTLGSKNHTVTTVGYTPEFGQGSAGFGLESFFRDHPSPNIEFSIDQIGSSINSTSTIEITNVEVDGILTPYEFNWTAPWLNTDGRWYFNTANIYPLGFLSSGAVFIVRLSILGDPGSYLLTPILNWAPDNLHRYRYSPEFEVPFAITGSVQRDINFENETYHIDILTNSTISSNIAFSPTEKEINFNATGYGGSTYFWNITIPRALMSDNPWTVTLGDTPEVFIRTTNGTHDFLYFNHTYSQMWFRTSKISIKGTQATVEFPSILILPLFIIATLLAVIVYKKTIVKVERLQRYRT